MFERCRLIWKHTWCQRRQFQFLQYFGFQLAQVKGVVRLGSERMASKGSGKSGEELVGQALARNLWSQGLSEEEAGRKKPWTYVFMLFQQPGKVYLKAKL